MRESYPWVRFLVTQCVIPKKKSVIRVSIEDLDTKNAIGTGRFAAKQAHREWGEKIVALAVVGHAPEYVTTDGHRSYPRAVRETLGNEVLHRTNKYLNNWIEQDHRGIKQRSYPMRGFGNFVSATRFCRAFDELHNYFRSSKRGIKVSLEHQRHLFCERFAALQELMAAIS